MLRPVEGGLVSLVESDTVLALTEIVPLLRKHDRLIDYFSVIGIIFLGKERFILGKKSFASGRLTYPVDHFHTYHELSHETSPSLTHR